MSGGHIRNILQKEWEVIFHDINNTVFVAIIPFLVVAEPLVFMWLADRFGGQSFVSNSLIHAALNKLLAEIPAAAGLPVTQL